MSLLITPPQLDISNIRYLQDRNNNNAIYLIYKDPLFTMKSIYILLKLHTDCSIHKPKYIHKSDLLPIIQLEYNILQKNKNNKYPVYSIKEEIYNKIKNIKLSYMYLNITGIWEDNTKCGLKYHIE